jgi:hypothetical protein
MSRREGNAVGRALRVGNRGTLKGLPSRCSRRWQLRRALRGWPPARRVAARVCVDPVVGVANLTGRHISPGGKHWLASPVARRAEAGREGTTRRESPYSPTLWSNNAPATLEEARDAFNAHPAIVEELLELLDLLEERAERLTYPLEMGALKDAPTSALKGAPTSALKGAPTSAPMGALKHAPTLLVW